MSARIIDEASRLRWRSRPQLSGGAPLTAGLGGGLRARRPLGDDVAQFLLQIRKLSPRAGKALVLDPLLSQASQNSASVSAPLFLSQAGQLRLG